VNAFPFPRFRCYIACNASFVNRARYTLAMLGLIEGLAPEFVDTPDSADLCYGYTPPSGTNAGWLPASERAHQFLAQKNRFDSRDAQFIDWNGGSMLRLFPVDMPHKTAVFGDILSSAFFFLSLYEEWSSPDRDQFGRFQAKSSLSGALSAHDVPFVAAYASAIRSMLEESGRGFPRQQRFGTSRAAICFTHDIDYISKRTPGLFYRELVTCLLLNSTKTAFSHRIKRFGEYAQFLFKPATDPYRVSLQNMKRREEENHIRGTWFFKAGGNDKRDVKYSLDHPFVEQSLRELLNAGHEVGIHPSFNAHADEEKFAREKMKLEGAGATVRSCRQHYLRFSYPDTWRIQQRSGVHIDSTMGFAEQEGFRNGTCHPFLPYDLDKDEPIPLWEVPLAAMDGTLAFYRGMNAADAERRLGDLAEIIRRYEGMAAFLFHNIIYDDHDFPGWGGIFDRFARNAAATGIAGMGLEESLTQWLGGIPPAESLSIIGSLIH